MQAKFILLPSDLSQTCLHIRWHQQSGHGSYRWQVFRFSVDRLSAPKRTCLRVCLVMESSLLRRYLKLWFNSCRIREFISVYRVGARNALNTEHSQNGCTSNRTQSPILEPHREHTDTKADARPTYLILFLLGWLVVTLFYNFIQFMHIHRDSSKDHGFLYCKRTHTHTCRDLTFLFKLYCNRFHRMPQGDFSMRDTSKG